MSPRSTNSSFRVTKPPGGKVATIRPFADPREPLPAARTFIQHTGLVLVHQAGVFYKWDGAAYRDWPNDELRAALYSFLEKCQYRNAEGDLVDFAPNSHKVRYVEDALRAVVNLSADVRAPAWLGGDYRNLDAYDFISFTNGLLYRPERILLEPTSDFFSFSSLPFPYEPDAPAPAHWLAFLRDLWPDDEESRNALQEWTGLLLTHVTGFQKILLLVGPPRSGKGVWSRTVRQLVGSRNYAALTMQSLAGPFGTQSLIGKTAAVITDARISGRVDGVAIVEKLLAISGEDSPAVQRKNLPDWHGSLSSRFTLTTNELPHLDDASGALFCRYLVLVLTRSHSGKEDRDLESRFTPELPGILLWALDGLDRLLARGDFVQPATGRELMEQLRDLGSPVRAFLQERCEIGTSFEVERSDLFTVWEQFCEGNGYKPGTSATLGKDLRAAFPKLGGGWRDGTRRVYRGLRLKPNPKASFAPLPYGR